MKKSIALVEDDDVIRDNYTELLAEAGFQVQSYSNREDALRGIQEATPDLALLDIELGSERDAGYQLCADIRRMSVTLPIVFLTSHDSEIDKISGLRVGADDYITKDSSIDYIIVRLEALFRRINSIASAPADPSASASDSGREASSLRLDAARCEAYWKDERIPLTLTQYWMLESLFEEPGKVKRAAELMDAASIVVEPNTIVAHIKAIRDAIKRIDASFDGIHTERGKGYRWLDA
jgi:two-component system OmpR family response regulator